MYFGHKHVETGPNYSYELAIFLKYHMPLKKKDTNFWLANGKSISYKWRKRYKFNDTDFQAAFTEIYSLKYIKRKNKLVKSSSIENWKSELRYLDIERNFTSSRKFLRAA